MEIPQKEPVRIASGLTISFQKSFANYLFTDGYTLAYFTINGAGGSKTIAGSYADGIWTFTLSAVSNGLAAGQYILYGWVETATSEKYEVYRGSLEVTASLTTAIATDQRSNLQKQLDLINAAINSYVVNPVEEISIAGRAYRRPTLIQLYKFRALTLKDLREERRKENIRNGRNVSRTILTKMVNA